VELFASKAEEQNRQEHQVGFDDRTKDSTFAQKPIVNLPKASVPAPFKS